MLSRARMRGFVGGAAILTLFGGLWCIWPLAAWPERPAWAIPTACAAIFVLLLLCILRWIASARILESEDPTASARGKRAGILFGIISGLEGGLIALASALLARSGLTAWIPWAVALIVGVHFLPLAYVFKAPLYYWTGALSVLGTLVCLFIHAGAMRTLCVGLVMAGVLWSTTLVILLQTRSRRSAVRSNL